MYREATDIQFLCTPTCITFWLRLPPVAYVGDHSYPMKACNVLLNLKDSTAAGSLGLYEITVVWFRIYVVLGT